MKDEGSGGVAAGVVLLGLTGFEVIAAAEVAGEVELVVQTGARLIGCPDCGVVATAKGRRATSVRDLPAGGRPVVLTWHKRVWCCRDQDCARQSWTETHPAIRPRAALTERARYWAFEQVGREELSVAKVAALLGVGWATVMRAVEEYGTPLVADPARLEGVSGVGVDETAFLAATAIRRTQYVTGIVDVTQAGRRGCSTSSPAAPAGSTRTGSPSASKPGGSRADSPP